MLKSLRIKRFRCFDDWSIDVGGRRSLAVIGRNGVGKSTVFDVLYFFHAVGSGETENAKLLRESDFFNFDTSVPILLEIEIQLDERIYFYSVSFDWPRGFKKIRTVSEKLACDGKTVFSREGGCVAISRSGRGAEIQIDPHRVALPVITLGEAEVFRQWLASMLLVYPIPRLIGPNVPAADFSSGSIGPGMLDFLPWAQSYLELNPAGYGKVVGFLKDSIFPDLEIMKPQREGNHYFDLMFEFENGARRPFSVFSDGEKCFVIAAYVASVAEFSGKKSMLCFWDEPENYLSSIEIQSLVSSLKMQFRKGQFFVSTHNVETLKAFGTDEMLIMKRNEGARFGITSEIFSDMLSSGENKWMDDIRDALEYGEG